MSEDSHPSPAQAICDELDGVRRGLERGTEEIPDQTDLEQGLRKTLDQWNLFGLAFSGGRNPQRDL